MKDLGSKKGLSRLILIASGCLIIILVAILTPLFFQPAPKKHKEIETKKLVCPKCSILLISIDALRADRLGISGYKRNTTPNIDSLAQKSTVFFNHFSQSFNTLPSHMSIFTSLYPQQHNVILPTDPPLGSQIDTLPEILQNFDIKTIGLYDGSVHLSGELGFGRGFDSYSITNNINSVLQAIQEMKDNQSFLFLHIPGPHDPYLVDPEISEKFISSNYQGKIDSDPQNYQGDFQEKTDKFWSQFELNNPEDLRHINDLYDAKIFATDQGLGRLFQELENLGLLDNTIIIITSDHGEEFFEHSSLNHGQLFDEVIHIPLIIYHPKIGVGGKVEGITQNIDIFPTILDVLGLPKSAQSTGKSLTPLLTDNGQNINDYTIAEWHDSASTRTSVWKLIIKRDDPKKSLLYDLRNDPDEKTNLSKQNPLKVGELKSLYQEVLEVNPARNYLTPAFLQLDKEKQEKLLKGGYF